MNTYTDERDWRDQDLADYLSSIPYERTEDVSNDDEDAD